MKEVDSVKERQKDMLRTEFGIDYSMLEFEFDENLRHGRDTISKE